MDKIQIKGIRQGRRKLKDGSYAVLLITKYGTLGLTSRNIPRFLAQNRHLQKYFHNGYIEAEDLIRKFIYVTNKSSKVEINGTIIEVPTL